MRPGLALRRVTDWIVVHCSASIPLPSTDVKTIDRWHRERGFLMVGYHFVIKTDGTLQEGRPVGSIGAHVSGHNARSIGICMVGGVDKFNKPENNFTREQFLTLLVLLKDLKEKYPTALIKGHRDFAGTNKACPSFDVAGWLTEVGIPQ